MIKDEAAWNILVPLTVRRLGTKVPNNIARNPPFCSFASFLIASLMPFINSPDSTGDLIILIISFFFFWLEIINAVALDRNIFLWIAASVADAAAINANGIKMLLANGLSIYPIKGNSIFTNGPKSLP